MPEIQTQTYFAKSIFTDFTSHALTLVVALQFKEVQDLLIHFGADPQLLTKIVAVIGVFLRLFHGTRPVAVIAPGEVKPVDVKRLEPTQPK